MVAALAEVARAAQHAHASPTNRPSPLRAATPRAAASATPRATAAAAAAALRASPAHHASPVRRAAPHHSREWWDSPAHHSCRPSAILLPTPSPSRAILAASRSSPSGHGALKPQQGQRRATSRLAAPPFTSPPPASALPAAAAERRRSSSSAALRLATGDQLRLAPREYGELAQATALRHANASPKVAWAEGAEDSHAWREEPRRTAAPPADADTAADAAADAAAAAYAALCARFGGDLSAAHLASLPRDQVRALSAELQRASG